jgi:integrase
MPKCPHLYRRGNTLYFRIVVPIRIRSVLRVREFTQSLRTQNRTDAIPAAYKLASDAKILFNYIDELMAEKELKNDLIQDLIECIEERGQSEGIDLAKAVEDAKRKNAGLPLKAILALKKKDIALELQEERHQEELRLATLQAKAEAFDRLLTNPPQAQQEPIKTASPNNAPMLSVAIGAFMAQYDPSKAGMLGKHRTALAKFLEFVGDKPINQIKHIDINRFFTGSLTQHHNASFKNYKTSIKQLVEWGRGLHEGAFSDVHIGDIKYSGNRTEKENSQRSFKNVELLHLFTCVKMREYCNSGADVHKFWLPVVGLYTGARVNEICQLNPFTDIVLGEGGVWYIQITEDTEAAEGVNKSVKTEAGKRIVPIHSKLIDLGLLDYVESLKSPGHKRLFPQWRAARGRAGENAAREFVRFIADIGLRDETKGKKLIGMHAFRKTALTRAYREKFIKEMLPIVGHESDLIDETGKALPAVTLDYIDDEAFEIPLAVKKATIEKLQFDIPFHKPVKPTFKNHRRAS